MTLEQLKKEITHMVKMGWFDTCFYRFDIEDYFTIRPMLENCFNELTFAQHPIAQKLIKTHKEEIADLFEELYNNSEPHPSVNKLIHNDY